MTYSKLPSLPFTLYPVESVTASYCVSDEDTDVKAIVASWLKKQDDSQRDRLSGLIEDLFYRALEWVLKVVSTTTHLKASHFFYFIVNKLINIANKQI